jgi:hypothetical protein
MSAEVDQFVDVVESEGCCHIERRVGLDPAMRPLGRHSQFVSGVKAQESERH